MISRDLGFHRYVFFLLRFLFVSSRSTATGAPGARIRLRFRLPRRRIFLWCTFANSSSTRSVG